MMKARMTLTIVVRGGQQDVVHTARGSTFAVDEENHTNRRHDRSASTRQPVVSSRRMYTYTSPSAKTPSTRNLDRHLRCSFKT